jgi:type II secretion system protein H
MKQGREGFTLIEIMLATMIMMLLVGAVSLSLRQKWEKEETRRAAQRILMVWMKAQSRATREGREWVVIWDKEARQFNAMPAVQLSQESGDTSSVSDLNFGFAVDKQIRVATEQDEEGAETAHFYGNGRAYSSSLLITGPRKDVWRIRLDYLGRPFLEFVSAPGNQKDLPAVKGELPKFESSSKAPVPATP